MKKHICLLLIILIALTACDGFSRGERDPDPDPQPLPEVSDTEDAMQALEDFIGRFLTHELWAGGDLGIRSPDTGNFYSWVHSPERRRLSELPMLSIGGVYSEWDEDQLIFDGETFYDRGGNQIPPSPPTMRRSVHTNPNTYALAWSYTLHDLKGDGIPQIIVVYTPQLLGGFSSDTVLYMFIDGEYREALELGPAPDFFTDPDGRVIVFHNDGLGGYFAYYYLELSATGARLEPLITLDDEWQMYNHITGEHVSWEDWNQHVADGTPATLPGMPAQTLTPLPPLTRLQDDITQSIHRQLGITPREDGPTQLEEGVWYIVTYNLNLREYHSTEAPSLGLVPGGTRVRALVYAQGDDREWVMIEFGGRQGFVAREFLMPDTSSP